MTTYIKSYTSNSGAEIKITGIIPNQTVVFPAFITSFSDSLTSNWNEEQVYGRPDPIGTFQSTQRKISISFDLPAASLAEAKKNLGNVNKIKQFMYPAYHASTQPASGSNPQVTTNALSLAKAPLVRIKFANLMDASPLDTSKAKTEGEKKPEDEKNTKKKKEVKKKDAEGLLGWIGSFSATPVIDMGMFNENKKLFPKVYNVSIDFTPQHEFDLGYKVGAKGKHTSIDKKFTKFPYDGGT